MRGLIWIILLLCPAACGMQADLALSKRFQEAQERFNTATAPEEFLQAANLYQQILDQGFISGAVLYNMGNAYMQADRRGSAIAAYRQAMRYRPRDPYLEANLAFALGPDAQVQERRTVLDHLLFWQKWLSYPEKCWLVIAMAGFALLFALASLYTRQMKAWKGLRNIALILTLVLAFSAAYDGYRYEIIQHGVVTGADVVARKGNSETYGPAFTEALDEGTEFRLIEERGTWLLIRLASGLEGWIPSKDGEVY